MKKLNLSKLLVASALLSSETIVHADTLAGVAFGGGNQSIAVCYAFNAGPGNVNVTSSSILSESGASLPIAGKNCSASLTPGSTCYLQATTSVNNQAVACRIIVSPSAANVRGEMEIRDSSNVVLNSVELR